MTRQRLEGCSCRPRDPKDCRGHQKLRRGRKMLPRASEGAQPRCHLALRMLQNCESKFPLF